MRRERVNRLLSGVLAVTLSLSTLPCQAIAEELLVDDTSESGQVEFVASDTSDEQDSDSSSNDTPSVDASATAATDVAADDDAKDAKTTITEDGASDEDVTEDDVAANADTDEEASDSDNTEEGTVTSYDQFLTCLASLEQYADTYVSEHAGEDAYSLIINYIRTGVERYTSSAWTTFCGPENTSFITYVADQDKANGTTASSLRNIEQFTLPNGDEVDFGHMFGCLDMAYHTKIQSTTDLGSWAGDLCDLVWLVTTTGIDTTTYNTVDLMADEIRTDTDKYFLHPVSSEDGHSFSNTDLYGDLDSLYVLNHLDGNVSMTTIMRNYFTTNLTNQLRAKYFLDSRFDGASAKDTIRDDVYNTYVGNEGIKTLEGTYLSDGVNDDIRKACCYAFADWLYLNAYDQDATSYYKVFSTQSSTLAPGITQVEKRAMTTDNKQIVYYLATADISRSDVSVYANYKDNDGSSWGMQRVSEQMQAAESKHTNADDADHYIENYKAVAGVNADFYNMSTGAPSGALVMEGTEYHGLGNENFFAILKDGSALIGGSDEWNTYESQIQEAVGGGSLLIKDGKIVIGEDSNYTSNRVSRTCVGITYDGQVVLMVLDGRQEPFSAGGAPCELAQIMQEAGCVSAMILDGGGSSTFAAKAEGSDSISVVNSPSDGYERSVSSSLLVVSTAKPSNTFDHAVISADYDYLTVGTSLDLSVTGVSATGGAVDVPEDATLKMDDSSSEIGTLSDKTFTASKLGDATVQLVSSDGTVLGTKTLHVVEPTDLKFTKDSINTVYGEATDLPLEATYNGNVVKINTNDVTFGYLKVSLTSMGSVEGSDVNTTKTELVFSYPEAGSITDFAFTPAADSTLRSLTIGAVLTSKLSEFQSTINTEYATAYQTAIDNGMSADNAAISAQTAAVNKALDTATKITAYMYKADEAKFDFNTAMGTDSTGLLAWNRTVEDSTYDPDEVTYILNDKDASGTAEYTFAVDMTKVPIPDKLSGLLYMLPGGDQEGKSAWDFMLQLAERISPLTTVTVKLAIPDGFTVDTAELKLVNDFFTLDSAKVEDGTLTITLKFITQSEPVNPTTANPICVLSGLKVTPTADATWEDDFLTCKLEGTVSYDIYAHFHVLKSLAAQTQYQEQYGLYPYDNSENVSGDYGAHFPNDVITFSDTYRLQRNTKQGWVQENGAWSYYQDGKALTGVNELPSFTNGEEGTFWYDLGTSGFCTDKLTGLFEKDGTTYYARFGELVTGWQSIQDSNNGDSHYYYFDSSTHKAATGETTINGLTYTFNDKGQLTRGAFYSDGSGTRYNVAGRDLWRQFVTLDEGTYWIDADRHVAYGYDHTVTTDVHDVTWYHFDEKTGLETGLATGVFTYKDGNLYYADENGKIFYGAIQTDKGIVFSTTLGKLSVSEGVYIDSTTGQKGCSLATGWYYAGDDGYLVKDGFATFNGNTYYYSNYTIAKGLTKVGDDYYLFNSGNGKMYKNATMWVGDNDYGFAGGMYQFDADGKMVLKNGFVTENGYTYYYVQGKRVKGFTKIGDDYYLFNASSGMMYTNATMWVAGENQYGFDGGMYYFGSDGKMQLKNGFVVENGYTYYYVNGERQKGFTKIGDDYYLFNASSGMMYHDATMWVNENDYGIVGGMYYFGSDGKLQLKSGFATETHKDGVTYTYYYVKGEKVKGFTKIGDDYYMFNKSSGMMYHDATMWVNANDYGVEPGMYYFGSDGKMQLPSA